MTGGDHQLAERIREESESAFEELFRSYCDPLCGFAESYVGSAQVAEDLVHDVFCDIWDRRRAFRPQGPIKSYLYRAVRNKALNWLKHRRVERNWEAEQAKGTPALAESATRDLEVGELQDAADRAVEQLTERQRQVFLMARRQDLSYAEIADVLGIAVKSVENHMGRALKRLRESLSTFLTVVL